MGIHSQWVSITLKGTKIGGENSSAFYGKAEIYTQHIIYTHYICGITVLFVGVTAEKV